MILLFDQFREFFPQDIFKHFGYPLIEIILDERCFEPKHQLGIDRALVFIGGAFHGVVERVRQPELRSVQVLFHSLNIEGQ